MGGLQATAAAVAAEIGGGDWRDYVRVWGEINCEHPLTSALKQMPCVHYSYSVQQEYEEAVRRQDAEGNWQTETQRGSETLSRYQQSVPFMLTDPSGQVWVNPEQAEIETVEVVNEFQAGEPAEGLLAMGGFRRSLGDPVEGRRVLGYRYRESLLPVDRPVLVVGAASDRKGTVEITKPLDNRKFIISLKSHEALASSSDTVVERTFWATVGFALVGALLVLLGWLL